MDYYYNIFLIKRILTVDINLVTKFVICANNSVMRELKGELKLLIDRIAFRWYCF